MGQTNLERSLAQAEAAVARSASAVREQRVQVAQLRTGGEKIEFARAQALLDMLEDAYRRYMGERSLIRQGLGSDSARFRQVD